MNKWSDSLGMKLGRLAACRRHDFETAAAIAHDGAVSTSQDGQTSRCLFPSVKDVTAQELRTFVTRCVGELLSGCSHQHLGWALD